MLNTKARNADAPDNHSILEAILSLLLVKSKALQFGLVVISILLILVG